MDAIVLFGFLIADIGFLILMLFYYKITKKPPPKLLNKALSYALKLLGIKHDKRNGCLMKNEDDKVRLALLEQRVAVMWRGFWGLITLGAAWIANNLLKLIGGS